MCEFKREKDKDFRLVIHSGLIAFAKFAFAGFLVGCTSTILCLTICRLGSSFGLSFALYKGGEYMNSAALLASTSALFALTLNSELSIWQVLGAVLVGLGLGAFICWVIERW